MGRLKRSPKPEERNTYELIKRLEKKPIDPRTGTAGGLKSEHAPVPLTRGMRFWLTLDEELIGDLDSAGCYHSILAVDHVLDVYEITDPEDRRDARHLLRCLGSGRAEALSEDL